MDISKEVTAAIEQHLPGAVGEVLRKRLEQAEVDAKSVTALTAERDNALKRTGAHAQTVADLQKQLDQHTKLAEREAMVSARENAANIFKATTELAAEQRISKAMQETMAGLVRNTEWRNSVHESRQRQVVVPYSGGGGNLNSVTENDSISESRSAG